MLEKVFVCKNPLILTHITRIVTKKVQFQAIEKLNEMLDVNLLYSTSRNYLDGSVYVERSGRIIGLCLDNVAESTLQQLDLVPEYFPHLQDIVIRNSHLKSIPDWLLHFTQIGNLVLKSLQLDNIDPILENLTQLEFLAVPDNNLVEINNLGYLQNLYRLNLNQNKLEVLPTGVEKLESLVSITANENYLKESDITLSSKVLQAVNLRNNLYNQIPTFLKNQPKLHHLDLSKNFINCVPDWISYLQTLEYLILSHNKISSIPKNIGQLSNLKYLKLDHNPGIEIQVSSIFTLDKLVELDIQNCKLNSVVRDKLLAFQKISEKRFSIIY